MDINKSRAQTEIRLNIFSTYRRQINTLKLNPKSYFFLSFYNILFFILIPNPYPLIFIFCQQWGKPGNTLKLPAIEILKEGHFIIAWIKDDGITLGGNTRITDARTGFQKTSIVVLKDNRLYSTLNNNYMVASAFIFG